MNRRYPTKIVGLANPTKVVSFGSAYYAHWLRSCAIDAMFQRPLLGVQRRGGSQTWVDKFAHPRPDDRDSRGQNNAAERDCRSTRRNTYIRHRDSQSCSFGESHRPVLGKQRCKPTTWGVPNVVALGNVDAPNTISAPEIRALTSDGLYLLSARLLRGRPTAACSSGASCSAASCSRQRLRKDRTPSRSRPGWSRGAAV